MSAVRTYDKAGYELCLHARPLEYLGQQGGLFEGMASPSDEFPSSADDIPFPQCGFSHGADLHIRDQAGVRAVKRLPVFVENTGDGFGSNSDAVHL